MKNCIKIEIKIVTLKPKKVFKIKTRLLKQKIKFLFKKINIMKYKIE